MLSALALYSQLVSNLLESSVKRVYMEEALDVKKVGEEELEDFVELIAIGRQGLVC
jgi:hypothetical protein